MAGLVAFPFDNLTCAIEVGGWTWSGGHQGIEPNAAGAAFSSGGSSSTSADGAIGGAATAAAAAEVPPSEIQQEEEEEEEEEQSAFVIATRYRGPGRPGGREMPEFAE